MQKTMIEGYRLSKQQRRLWKLQRSASASALHAQCAIRINGSSDPSVLRRAVERVISRHEALRTAFHSLPGMEAPIQVISEEARLAWHEVDLRGMEERERQRALAEIMRQERRLGSEANGDNGIVRASVAAMGEDECVIVVSMSALVGDTQTLSNLVGELCAGYAAESGGGEDEENTTGEEIVQYVDYSEWQNDVGEEAGESDAEGHEFWKQRDEAVELMLPLERQLGSEKAKEIAEEPEWEEVEIDEELRRGVERAGREEGVSEEAVLLACWQALLARLTGKREISVSVLLHGRGYEEMRQAFGLYARWPPVRGVYYDEFSFSEALSHLNKTLQRAYEWQEYFMGEQRDDQGSSLCASLPVGFEYQSWPSPCSNSALSFSLLDLFSSSDLFKLRLCLAASPRFLRARFFFDPRRFSRASVRLLASQFVSLLRSVVGSPRSPVGELDVLGDEERGLLLSQSRRQARRYSNALPIKLFEQWAARIPQKVAVECGERRLSFAELDRLALALARRLREMGAGPDQRVALLLERSVEMVAAALGVWKAGAAYVPLDLSQPEARIAAVIRDAGVVAVLSSRAVMERVNLGGRRTPVILVEEVDEAQCGESRPEPPAPVEMSGDELAYLIYTSGTTGQAKGVMVRHSSVANLIWALEEAVYAKQGLRRVSVNAPLAFDSSVKQLAQVCRGRTLVVVPEDVRPDPRLLVSYLREKEVELLDSTPSQLRALLEAGLEAEAAAPGREGGQGGALRAVLVGGEAIDEALWRRLAGARLAFYNVYGPTECTVDATCEPIRDECDGPCLGTALGNMEVYVLDDERRPAPAGVVGELCVGGAGVARGYRGDAGKTAEKFIPDWLSGKSGARLYRTGDLARVRDDGRIEYVGRGDGQVKIRGYRVEVGEVEAALMSHGSVREAVVAPREAEDGEKRLVAYVVGAEVDSEELRRLLRERLPEYMIPGCIAPLDKMPLTRNGKIDRGALPDPERLRAGNRRERLAPRTPVEQALHGIWSQVLRSDQIGVDENFFELGGHSLMAAQIVSRMREAFQLEIPLRSLFDAVTIEQQAAVVEQARQNGDGLQSPAIVRVSRQQYRASVAVEKESHRRRV